MYTVYVTVCVFVRQTHVFLDVYICLNACCVMLMKMNKRVSVCMCTCVYVCFNVCVCVCACVCNTVPGLAVVKKFSC